MSLHPLLVRQLQRQRLNAAAVPPEWRALLERVSQVYTDADQERYRLERMITTCSDEMSELNAALTAERDRLFTIVASMGEGLCVLDGEGKLELANAAAARMLGHDPHDLAGRRFSELVETEGLQTAIVDHGVFQSEDALLLTATGPLDVAISLSQLPRTAGDEEEGSVVIFRNVRERKLAEDELRASERRFRAVFESAAVGIIRAEMTGKILECNAAYAAMLGRSRAEVEGASWVDFVHPDEREAAAAAAAAGEPIDSSIPFERRYLDKSGSVVWASVSASTVRDPAGVPLFNIAIVRDVTEQRHLEISLRHAQRLEAVGRLAAGIAHEINTPIQFVGDNLAFLQKSIEDLLHAFAAVRALVPAERHGDLAHLEETADLAFAAEEGPLAVQQSLAGIAHVAEIVHAMKVFAHQGSADKPTNVDLAATIRNVSAVARSETRGVAELVLELDDHEAPILGFQNDLNQVFLNLLVNAAHAVADARGEGGGVGTIRIACSRDADSVVVAIEDSGAGIPEAIRGQIFDPFFTTKEVGRGTGQGLALARAIVVDKHGGTIDFDTEMGRGTTFYVRLPVHRSPSSPPGEIAA